MSKLFGTDGVRGIANQDLTPELAFNIGKATSLILKDINKDLENNFILIGTDTRKSKDLLEASLVSGICSMGVDVISLGVVPTPVVSFLVRHFNALGGIVVSASHNPPEYNGIKVFNGNGYKLGDVLESDIEDLIVQGFNSYKKPIGEKVGINIRNHQAIDFYIKHLESSVSVDFKDLKVAVDCGNGAASEIAPLALKSMGADLVSINTEPNGMNINVNCGSTCPAKIQELVLETKADIGLSFDGDADRLIAVDEKGRIMNGDHILAVCASELKRAGKLKNNTVVCTVMSNMGLDEYLESQDIKVVKSRVGDKYVIQDMRKGDYVLGGEQSGHIIFSDYNTTGDGLQAGYKLLEVLKKSGKKLSDLNDSIVDYSQVLVNAKVRKELKHTYMEEEDIKNKIDQVIKSFEGKGRVLIRPSGTEPLVRVMIESKNGKNKDGVHIKTIAEELANFIEERIG